MENRENAFLENEPVGRLMRRYAISVALIDRTCASLNRDMAVDGRLAGALG